MTTATPKKQAFPIYPPGSYTNRARVKCKGASSTLLYMIVVCHYPAPDRVTRYPEPTHACVEHTLLLETLAVNDAFEGGGRLEAA